MYNILLAAFYVQAMLMRDFGILYFLLFICL